MSQESEQYRVGFEAWARSNDITVGRYSDGTYVGMIEWAWKSWCASKSEANIGAIAEVPPLPQGLGGGRYISAEDAQKYGEACYQAGYRDGSKSCGFTGDPTTIHSSTFNQGEENAK